MAVSGRTTVVCVDMGMTGSAVRWKFEEPRGKWFPVFESKVPTSIAYYGDKFVEFWGEECSSLPPADVCERFKVHFGKSDLHKSEGSGSPSSRAELERWVHDYLQKLSEEIVEDMNKKLGGSWKESQVRWNFTFPGSWGLTTVLEFKGLAEAAVLSHFAKTENVHVQCDHSEASASAMALLVNGFVTGEPLYSIGNLITCDIGGSSTDIAVAHITGLGTLEIMKQFEESPLGVVTVENDFQHHVNEVLRGAGVLQVEELTRGFVRGKRFLSACIDVGKKSDRDWFKFPLMSESMVELPPPSNKNTFATLVNGGFVYIHRKTFASFFDKFISQIKVAIDGIIDELKPNLQPALIGFCGGGSQFEFVTDSLRRRYEDYNIPVLDYRHLSIVPQMATVIRGTILWDQSQVQNFVGQTRFGIKKDGAMFWQEGCQSLAPSSFRIPFRGTVTFHCSKTGNHNKIHEIMTIPVRSSLPDTHEEALAAPGCQSWKVELELHQVPRSGLWRKYKIVCDIIGVGILDIKVVSCKTEKPIPAKVLKVDGTKR